MPGFSFGFNLKDWQQRMHTIIYASPVLIVLLILFSQFLSFNLILKIKLGLILRLNLKLRHKSDYRLVLYDVLRNYFYGILQTLSLLASDICLKNKNRNYWYGNTLTRESIWSRNWNYLINLYVNVIILNTYFQ